ncbi:histone H1.11R-like [Heliangelus exortis]|uniref:histone H1.11R-like n=1 Tax=Heliangelus exortis TaxID=472823 RepID=UPI003A953A02
MPSLRKPSQALLKKLDRSSLTDRILSAVSFSMAPKGASFIFIKKVLAAEGYDVSRNRSRVKGAVRGLLRRGLLKRVTGSGVAGSFRLAGGGKKRLEGTGRQQQQQQEVATGGVRQSGFKETKGSERRFKATTVRLKPRKRRRKATAVAEKVEEDRKPAVISRFWDCG